MFEPLFPRNEEEPTMAKKLYVGSLPYETTEQELKELFAQAGTVESASVISDRYSGRSKGFGFVEMSTDEEAQKAVEMFNNYQMGSRNIVVNEARPKPEFGGPRGGGGGGFGGRGGRGGYDR